MSLPLQAKLLRVLQDKQIRAVGGTHLKLIDVRIVAATHRDLRTMVRHGEFREDLYYRLNVIPIKVPPLRERKEDIPLLVKHFLSKFSQQEGFSVKDVSSEALTILMSHTWPGNVRELENVIERAIVLSHGEMTENAVILDKMSEANMDEDESLEGDRPTLEKLEERYIKKVLNEVDHKIDDAAKVLGISRRTLYRKERLYGINGFQDEGPIESEDHTIN
jgi:transcriptional regulator with PAS, ATPase and Fis domain